MARSSVKFVWRTFRVRNLVCVLNQLSDRCQGMPKTPSFVVGFTFFWGRYHRFCSSIKAIRISIIALLCFVKLKPLFFSDQTASFGQPIPLMMLSLDLYLLLVHLHLIYIKASLDPCRFLNFFLVYFY